MAITGVYPHYFQKSKLFLFPALQIIKSEHTSALSSFLRWPGRYRLHDCRLILVNSGDINSTEYRRFEKIYLLTSVFFEHHVLINGTTMAYIYNLEAFKEDWQWFLQGKYSRLSRELKDRIKQYYGERSSEWEYVKSYLYPENYFHLYEDFLGLEEGTLRQTGELCDRYDEELETFRVIQKVLDKSAQKVSL